MNFYSNLYYNAIFFCDRRIANLSLLSIWPYSLVMLFFTYNFVFYLHFSYLKSVFEYHRCN
jgi:hypothetical protein